MNGFEYLLTLFGLLLGLALAEGLGGLVKAVHVRRRTPIGWPTALLGVFVSCNIVAFWINGWALRDVLPVSWPVMFCGFMITGAAYVSSSLIFPIEAEDWANIDSYFFEHRRIVLGGLLLCNVAFLAAILSMVSFTDLFSPRRLVIIWSVYPVWLVAMYARQRPLVLAALGYMIAIYPLSVVWRG